MKPCRLRLRSARPLIPPAPPPSDAPPEPLTGLPPQAPFVGDGANDLGMIEAAGLGVAYHAKPAVSDAASARIDHSDLTALLYAQGYTRAEFVE